MNYRFFANFMRRLSEEASKHFVEQQLFWNYLLQSTCIFHYHGVSEQGGTISPATAITKLGDLLLVGTFYKRNPVAFSLAQQRNTALTSTRDLSQLVLCRID